VEGPPPAQVSETRQRKRAPIDDDRRDVPYQEVGDTGANLTPRSGEERREGDRRGYATDRAQLGSVVESAIDGNDKILVDMQLSAARTGDADPLLGPHCMDRAGVPFQKVPDVLGCNRAAARHDGGEFPDKGALKFGHADERSQGGSTCGGRWSDRPTATRAAGRTALLLR